MCESSSLVASLSQSFRQVPPAAVPAILDCILASTALSPSSLFSSLLDAFPDLTKDAMKEEEKLDSDQCNYLASLVGALCHLLIKSDAVNGDLQLFIWKVFIPLMRMAHVFDRGLLNQIAESFFSVVIGTDSWEVVEAALVPFFLRSVGLTIGIGQNKESGIPQWSECSESRGLHDLVIHAPLDKEYILSLSQSFPLPISCHILTLTLDAALKSHQTCSISQSISIHGCSAEKFAVKLLWHLCNMIELLLMGTLEHRSCTLVFLLPVIFKAFILNHTFEFSVHGQTCTLSRNSFLMKIWRCCSALFSLGYLERRDAYNVLSLYLSSFSNVERCEDADANDGLEEFDLRAEKDFWDEIKRGLVDKEGLVRKQSLHILKHTLRFNGGKQIQSGGIVGSMDGESSVSRGNLTKRGAWAEKEAKSLGVGKIFSTEDPFLNSQQQWEAFFLLYEMLEEYGTHLVEAAWNNQITLLLQCSASLPNSISSTSTDGLCQNGMEISSEIFNWLSILWERGFCHDNPLVRCLVMQSFLEIQWTNYGDCAGYVPESFLLGPFIQGLNDPAHHKDFGVRGAYSSRTIEGAAQFFRQYTGSPSERRKLGFLRNLASLAKQESFGRAGLVAFVECIASAAWRVNNNNCSEGELCLHAFSSVIQVEPSPKDVSCDDKQDLLDLLRFIIESSKQHFNPNYRLRVSQKVLEAAASVVCIFDVPLETLLLFIATIPREFTDYGGALRVQIQKWLSGCGKKHCAANCRSSDIKLLRIMFEFPQKFISHRYFVDASITYDDEDVDAWEHEVRRWARVLFLVTREEYHLIPLLEFIQSHSTNISKQSTHQDFLPVKLVILIMSLVMELQMMQNRVSECGIRTKIKSEVALFETIDESSYAESSIIVEKFAKFFPSILEEVVSFANFSCSIFMSSTVITDTILPGSIRGKLGGPSQRRLSTSTTTAALQAIMSMKAVSSITSWCAQFQSEAVLNEALKFLWQFVWKIFSSPIDDSETGAEICLAAYETLAPVLSAVVSTFSPSTLDIIREHSKSLQQKIDGRSILDILVLSFLQSINKLLAVGVLARSRRAVLLNWKWLCLEHLLSMPCHALKNEVKLEGSDSFFSDAVVRLIFCDLLESLENAGEGSVLPILRSVRWVLGLLASRNLSSVVSSCNGVDSQIIWQLVRSSWILHVSCNKRRVAPIAALLSSVLHSSVFSDEGMHVIDDAPGPLKWFIENVLEEGKKSPRTMRLAALHLTGLWLSYPKTIKYYVKELKLLSLYGSVAFDEDFEAELSDNHDARTEVSLLGGSPDPEFTDAFINTELYARVSVSVLFHKLANLVDIKGSVSESEDCRTAREAGKLFLLELLDSAVNDKDLSKELYKKYSAIHRRKVRVWQMICILSRFIDQDIVGQVSEYLHKSLYRNNLPAIRQYLETFAIHIYLKFPSLVREQLVPILKDFDTKPQALSSYVFIAANVILHAPEKVQSRHLEELLPPVVPLLTSHHHSLRGFTQLLVYHVLCKLFPPLDSAILDKMPLEKRCFEDLKSYLGKNPDCMRLRGSMEGYLEAFDPIISVTPAGIFVNRVEELEFECVPTSLMEQVLSFLNDARDELRSSMAKDVVTIRNESLKVDGNPNITNGLLVVDKDTLLVQQPNNISLDFQKKITLHEHEKQDSESRSFLDNMENYNRLAEMENEDQLLNHLLQSRSMAMERIRASQQHIVLVASLIDRIPNLAGLARTCEVFKAAGLVIADRSVLRDKQFQLISVTAEKWVPIIEVPVNSVKIFLEKKKQEGFSILGLEQTANSVSLDQYTFPKKTVLVLGREKEGIPVDIIHILDACIEIPQLGVVRSLNVHVSGAIALWEYTRQQRSQ